MENTKINWAHCTFNPWRGCQKVSEGCDNCYAEAMSVRNPAVLGIWGPGGTRPVAAESYWRMPLKWDRQAALAGESRRVFCLSLGDWLEYRPDLEAPLARLLKTIHLTPSLDWLLLTKRPNLWRDRMKAVSRLRTFGQTADVADGGELAYQWVECGAFMPNVWFGISVENERWIRRRNPAAMEVPARVHFWSYEPALGPLDLRCASGPGSRPPMLPDWIIAGGESGPHARSFHLQWARNLLAQCRECGVAFWMKQAGSDPVEGDGPGHPLALASPKGENIDELPADLRVRELPGNSEFRKNRLPARQA